MDIFKNEIKRREFIKTVGLATASIAAPGILSKCSRTVKKPNIIYILADDLGYGELGCYGQQKIKTPNIDRLAAEGMKFSQHYSGSPVCAPSRCTLLTGKHTGHSQVRANDEMAELGDVWNDPRIEGQWPLTKNTETIGTSLQNTGYTTSVIGKWGLGGPGSTGEPNKQGFDHWFGYLCQRQAHNYYPPHLWKNDKKFILEGNDYFSPHQKFPDDADPHDLNAYAQYSTKHYAPDLMAEEALNFIKSNKDNPFFLYFATPIPHVALQIPADSLKKYEDAFPETPYLGEKGYLPHPAPRAAYAAMISRMDRDIGHIIALLKKLGLDKDTLVIFSSDNGPTYAGGVDYEFFKSAGPLRELKGRIYEGGIRVPMIAHWPGHIKSGTESAHISAFWDVMPTLCEIANAPIPPDTDGISFAPTLLGSGVQNKHAYLYWEFLSYGGQQAVRMGRWKGIRTDLKNKDTDTSIQLYDLKEDIKESNNIAADNPEVVAKIKEIMQSARTKSGRFPFPELLSRTD
jgi:arylsulfatase